MRCVGRTVRRAGDAPRRAGAALHGAVHRVGDVLRGQCAVWIGCWSPVPCSEHDRDHEFKLLFQVVSV